MVRHLSDMSNQMSHRIYYKPEILVGMVSVYHAIFSLPALNLLEIMCEFMCMVFQSLLFMLLSVTKADIYFLCWKMMNVSIIMVS